HDGEGADTDWGLGPGKDGLFNEEGLGELDDNAGRVDGSRVSRKRWKVRVRDAGRRLSAMRGDLEDADEDYVMKEREKQTRQGPGRAGKCGSMAVQAADAIGADQDGDGNPGALRAVVRTTGLKETTEDRGRTPASGTGSGTPTQGSGSPTAGIRDVRLNTKLRDGADGHSGVGESAGVEHQEEQQEETVDGRNLEQQQVQENQETWALAVESGA
ncbi:hypothetical protein HN873_047564, partial [Arachis hypogaea]